VQIDKIARATGKRVDDTAKSLPGDITLLKHHMQQLFDSPIMNENLI